MKPTQQFSAQFRVSVANICRATTTRGGGKRFRRYSGSSVAAVAYQTAQSLYCARLKRCYNYPRPAEEIVATRLLVPAFAPSWARDRRELWKRNELHNRRKDARVAISAIVSIPHNLAQDRATAVAAVRVIAQRIVRAFSVGVDFAVHAPSAEGDARNYHAHLVISTSTLTAPLDTHPLPTLFRGCPISFCCWKNGSRSVPSTRPRRGSPKRPNTAIPKR